MKKHLIAFIFMIFLALAVPLVHGHGDEDDGHEDVIKNMDSHDSMSQTSMDHSMHSETGLSHQVQMVLPFSHFSEGHLFSGILLIILWLSLIYAIFSLFNGKEK